MVSHRPLDVKGRLQVGSTRQVRADPAQGAIGKSRLTALPPLTLQWGEGAGKLRPADDVGPQVLYPPCRLAALPGGIADLAPIEADVAQHALVEAGQGVHGAPRRQLPRKRRHSTPGRGQQTADHGTWLCEV